MKDDLKFSNILFDRYKAFLSTFLRMLTNLSKSGEDWQDGGYDLFQNWRNLKQKRGFVSKMRQMDKGGQDGNFSTGRFVSF